VLQPKMRSERIRYSNSSGEEKKQIGEMIYTSDDQGRLISLEPRTGLHLAKTSKRHAAVIGMLQRKDGRFLLQWRGSKKLGGSRLDVSATTHIREGETYESAIQRSFQNELRISYAPKLRHLFDFVYEEELGEHKENEFCRVFLANYDGNYDPNPDEIETVELMTLEELKDFASKNEKKITKWLAETIKRMS
jgi:isopentenyldiphosphate isomerase